MVAFLKLMLAFAPWLSFLIIAQGSLFRLQLGLAVALLLSIVMGIAHLHRGVILWTGLAFFTFCLVAVVFFEKMWVVRFMGVLANGALASATWVSIALRKPFTLDYAKANTDPSVWHDPRFIRTNDIITSVWGLVFTLNAIIAGIAAFDAGLSAEMREAANYSLLLMAAVFSVWYPKVVSSKLGPVSATDGPGG